MCATTEKFMALTPIYEKKKLKSLVDYEFKKGAKGK